MLTGECRRIERCQTLQARSGPGGVSVATTAIILVEDRIRDLTRLGETTEFRLHMERLPGYFNARVVSRNT